MSAEVIILNKRGMALAADSAVTLSGTSAGKIYNSADKLFALSKYHPVAIMIYGTMTFMGIDWEIIIKSYRDSLGDKSFDKLTEYEGDFINYLAKFPYFTEEQMVEYLEQRCFDAFSQVLSKIIIDLQAEFEGKEHIESAKIDAAINATLKAVKARLEAEETEKQIRLDIDFIDANEKSIKKMLGIVFEKYDLSKKQTAELTSTLKLHLQKIGYIDDENYSGIVIAGYGERELYPSVCEFKASGKLGNALICFGRGIAQIGSDNFNAGVFPFAQVDMVHQFARGIDNSLRYLITQKIETLLETVLPSADTSDESVEKKRKAVFSLMDDYIHSITRTLHTDPILDIVGSMQPKEMLLMAEAMINLTALKRHISDEQESVGGFIDVALITKNEGFIWIKKKTSYDTELNRDLNQNYFRGRKNGNL